MLGCASAGTLLAVALRRLAEPAFVRDPSSASQETVRCTQCEKLLEDDGRLLCLDCSSDTSEPIACPKCRKVYDSQRALDYHYANKSVQSEKLPWDNAGVKLCRELESVQIDDLKHAAFLLRMQTLQPQPKAPRSGTNLRADAESQRLAPHNLAAVKGKRGRSTVKPPMAHLKPLPAHSASDILEQRVPAA